MTLNINMKTKMAHHFTFILTELRLKWNAKNLRCNSLVKYVTELAYYKHVFSFLFLRENFSVLRIIFAEKLTMKLVCCMYLLMLKLQKLCEPNSLAHLWLNKWRQNFYIYHRQAASNYEINKKLIIFLSLTRIVYF